MSTRRSYEEPNYSVLNNPKELSRIEKEITQFRPKTEVTIEGSAEIATGRIIEWYPKRKFFSVKWNTLPDLFAKITESKIDLRVFFKAHLFSTQVLFKSTTLRRLSETETSDGSIIFHYRVPDQIYQQQRRGALRVPLIKKLAHLETRIGDFDLIDLSVTGAKLKMNPDHDINIEIGQEWKNASLWFGKQKMDSKNFNVRVTRVTRDWFAVKFTKISDLERTQIKQFLIEAMRVYYATRS